MLDLASTVGTKRPVEWRQADAMQLPFRDGTFDAVVCQFGVMFFAEKAKAFSEARRVLGSGGVFIFNVWDRIEENEFADTVTTALESLFPEDPPRFMARTPHGYYDRSTIERDLENGGFTASPKISTVAARSRAASPRSQRSLTARGHHYGTRSRRATPRGSAKQPTSRRRLSPAGSGEGLWMARSRHTLSPSKTDRLELRVLRPNEVVEKVFRDIALVIVVLQYLGIEILRSKSHDGPLQANRHRCEITSHRSFPPVTSRHL